MLLYFIKEYFCIFCVCLVLLMSEVLFNFQKVQDHDKALDNQKVHYIVDVTEVLQPTWTGKN